MGLEPDDEILQDFLVEAGEIVEKLSEELVALEKSPADTELLNGIFRGFHTIKGGAGFLNIDPVVSICHRAEDVFSLCRQGKLQVDAEIMDIVFRVVDTVIAMLDQLRNGREPEGADPALLKNLERWAGGQQNASTPSAKKETKKVSRKRGIKQGDKVPVKAENAGSDGSGDAATVSTTSNSNSDDISDEEFEALLDELHGKGKHGGVPPVAASPSSDITDDEFEALLDQLHGKGQHGGMPRAAGAGDEGSNMVAGPPRQSARNRDPGQQVTDRTATRQKTPRQGDTTLRIDTRRLDEIMNLVGELVLVRNRLTALDSAGKDESITRAIDDLDLVTSDLQVAVMKSRMQPIQKVFSRFPRVVRDVARQLNKEVVLEITGEDTDMEKNMVESLVDPLVHLVRNSIDHGIESPDDREQASKSRQGKIVLSACQEGDHINLMIEDDGAGMNADNIRNAALRKGVITPDEATRMTDRECFNLIFLPGFTTKEVTSDVSGRGVGMDVVKTRIEQLGGTIEIDSTVGKGTRIIIELPLSLAILPTLMIVVGTQIFAMPLSNVVEIFQLDLQKTNVVDGQRVVIVRDRPLPLYHLRRWLGRDSDAEAGAEVAEVVIARIGSRHVAFVVDQLIGQEEVVIKPLGALIHGTKGVSGATITGNGRIALILDLPGLVSAYG